MKDISYQFIATGLLLFCVNFVYVAFKALQQLAVTNFNFTYVIPTSLVLALCEVTTITILAIHKDIMFFPFLGVGAGLGACSAMLWYKTKHKKYKEEKIG